MFKSTIYSLERAYFQQNWLKIICPIRGKQDWSLIIALILILPFYSYSSIDIDGETGFCDLPATETYTITFTGEDEHYHYIDIYGGTIESWSFNNKCYEPESPNLSSDPEDDDHIVLFGQCGDFEIEIEIEWTSCLEPQDRG